MLRSRGIASTLALAISLQTAAVAQHSAAVDMQPMRLPPRETMQQQRQPTQQKKELNLEDLFPKTEIPYAYPNPVDLSGMTVGGLSEKNTATLGTNLFVVVDNTKYDTIADLYRSNRLKKKSNFVTVDALMHSFLAMRNGILASTVVEHAYPELTALVAAMMKTTSADYNEADDAEVRGDLEKNLAFLSVGLRLLDPSLPSPQMGNATVLATKELQNIRSFQYRRSAIFGVDEDFSTYKPYGWYNSSTKLQNFFKAKQWFSRVSFQLSENSKAEGAGDSFRRSALLFRALDRSSVGKEPGIQIWQRLNQIFAELGPIISTEIKTLTPADYKEVFKSSNGDLKMSLQGLAEPFYRTKLLLSVRRQRPVQISSTSIFDIESSHPERASQAAFRLFPIVEPAELDWLKQRSHRFAKEGSDVPPPPLALLNMHARGFAQATNVLGENIWKLDPTLVTVVPTLMQAVKKQPAKDVVWQTFGSYFKMPVEAVQAVLKTNNWMTRKIESGFGAWVDNQIAMAPAVPRALDKSDEPFAKQTHDEGSVSPRNSAGGTAANAAGTTPANPSGVSAPSAPLRHYVEPAPEVFRNMRNELARLTTKLNGLGYTAQQYQARRTELESVLTRLETIAAREVSGLNPLAQDGKFLSEIDLVLDKFSPPTAAALFLDNGVTNENEPKGTTNSGASLVLGRPAMLFIIFQSGRSLTVARGAMYSYHELPGGPISTEHLERKMEFGFLTPPPWAEAFEVIQDQPTLGGN